MRDRLRGFWKSGRCRMGLLCAMGVLAVAAAAGLFAARQARAACNLPSGDEFPVTLTGDEALCLGAGPGNYTASAPVSGTFTWSSDGAVMDVPTPSGSTATVPTLSNGSGWVGVEFTPDPGSGSGVCARTR